MNVATNEDATDPPSDDYCSPSKRPWLLAAAVIATALGFHSSQMIVTSSQSKEELADVMRALEGFIDTPYLDLELEDEQEQASSNDD